MRRLLLLLALCWCASAATHVQIRLTINDGTTAAMGSLYLTGPRGGSQIATTRKITIDPTGLVDTSLVGCAACYYDIVYNFTDAQGRKASSPPSERWFIPDTASTLSDRLMLLGGSSAPAYLVNPQQVNPGGLLPGQLWLWDGAAWSAAYPATSSDAGVSDPGSNGLMYRSALNVSRPATVADIVAAFGGGSCSGYLKSTGGCDTPAGGPGGTGAFADLTGLPSDNTALNAALSAKANTADLSTHTARQDNPHVVTKTQIGLPSVTNDAQLKIASNLSDLGNLVTARSNLGLGAAALLGVGTATGTVAAGDHNHSEFAPLSHVHPASEITSGTFGYARLGSGGTGSGAKVLWDNGTWSAPPGASGGEANTASNGGTGGVGITLAKSGTDLPFKSLYAASNKISLTDDPGNQRIAFDIVSANIDHADILNHGTSTHAQIDTHLAATNNPHGTTAAQAGAPALTLLTTAGDLPYRDAVGWQRLAAAAGFLKWTGAAFTYSTPTKTDVGLPNVDNTADASKPVSTAQQTALDLKAPLASPALTGVPTAPTAAPGTNTTQVASTAFVKALGDTKAASNASTTVNGQTCALGSTCAITVSGVVSQTTGLASALPATCTAASASALQFYYATDTSDHYFCGATNTWLKVLATLPSAAFSMSGTEQSALATPAAGAGACWFDSTEHGLNCKFNNSATVYRLTSLSTTVLGYLSGITSAVQGQIDGKVPTTRTVNGKALSADVTLVPSDITGATATIASGTSALGTSAIASGACATVVTTAATGAAATDAITWTPNADITAVTGYAPVTTGGLAIYPYPTANNVNWKVCNPTSASITPGAVTINWRITR